MPDTSNRSASPENAVANKAGVLTGGDATGSVGASPAGSMGAQGADSSVRKAPPYPVAALIRRTRNAKSARDLHDIAFNGWEASMRLAVAAKPPPDVSMLFEPSTGSWAASIRANLSDTKLDDPHLTAVYALFSRVGAGVNASPMFVTPKMLFEYIASYRNQLHGHGAVRGAEFYDSAGEILLNGLEAAWRHWIFLPDRGELVFVQSVELDAAGQRRARVYLLKGGEPMLESRIGSTDIPEGLRPRRLYLRVDKRYFSLHPWLLYDDKDERERVLYYNGRNKYLDFISGETPRIDKLQDSYPTLFKELDALFRGKAATIFADASEKNPNDFGDYEIICELGRGGMASVSMAKQKSLERRVALKMPLPGVANDPVAIQRFAREIQVLSQCDHPNVVKILDSGVHEGTPFYVMEYIEGADLSRIAKALAANGSIDDAISNASFQVKMERAELLNLPAPPSSAKIPASPSGPERRSRQELVANSMQRLTALFRDAARGLHHLHEHGIIHRDIKPGNLMLTDGEHRIVVMDLGLAALANMTSSLARDNTALLGTLRYMAPEQLQRQPISLDRRADIYSLCATFYELLAGKPFLEGVNEQQLLHQILYEEPVPLGTANPFVPSDIQMIVAKGIQKDPRLRYQNAEELARDLNRWLRGEPIAARDPSLAYLLSLSIRRHKALVLTGAACLAVVLGVTVLAVWVRQDLLVTQNEQAKKIAATEKEAKRTVVLASAKDQLVFGAAMENDGQFGLAKKSYDSARASLLALGEPVEEADTHLNLLYLRHRPPLFYFDGHRQIENHKGRIFSIACSPKDDTVALTAGEENGIGIIKLWDLRTGQQTENYKTMPGDRILSARFNPDGTKVLFSGWLSKLNLWTVKTGAVVAFSGLQEPIACVAFSPDGDYAVSGSYNGNLRIWDMQTAAEVDSKDAQSAVVRSLTYLADGTICSGGSSGQISIWNFNRSQRKLILERTFSAHKGGINGLAFVDNGKSVVSCGDDRLLKIWNVADGKELGHAYGHQSEVAALGVFEQDNNKYAVSACGTTLRIWDLDHITEPQTIDCGWHESAISGLAMLSNGKRVMTAGVDGSLMMWNVPFQKFQKTVPFDVYSGVVRSVKLSANGKLALACGDNENKEFKVRLLDVESGLQLREFTGLKAAIRTAIFSADEKSVLAIDVDGCVMEWRIDDATSDAPSRVIRKDQPHPTTFITTVFSPDSRRAAISVTDCKLDVIDVQTGATVNTLVPDDTVKVSGASFSADGERLLTSNMEGTLRLWEVGSSKKPKRISSPGNSPVFGLVLTADGKRAIAGGMDFVCRMWDLEQGEEIRTFEGHNNSVVAVAYSPVKNQIATGSFDQSIRIWDADDGRELYSFKSLKGSVVTLAYSNDGRSLIYGCKNGKIELLDFNQAARIRMLQERIVHAQNVLKTKNDAESLTIVGELLSLQGAWADATDRMDAARKLSPGSFDAYSMLGKCFWIRARNEDNPVKRTALYNSAFEAYRTERDRLKIQSEAAGTSDLRQELMRYNLILSAIESEIKKAATTEN